MQSGRAANQTGRPAKGDEMTKEEESEQKQISKLRKAHPEWGEVWIAFAGDDNNNLWDQRTIRLDEMGNFIGHCWIHQPALTKEPIEIYCDIPIIYNQRVVIGRLNNNPDLLRVLSTL